MKTLPFPQAAANAKKDPSRSTHSPTADRRDRIEHVIDKVLSLRASALQRQSDSARRRGGGAWSHPRCPGDVAGGRQQLEGVTPRLKMSAVGVSRSAIRRVRAT